MHFQKPAINDLLKALSKDFFNVLYLGEGCSLDILELIDRCNENNIKVAGGIFPGVIYNSQHSSDGVILNQLPSDTPHVIFGEDGSTLIPLPEDASSATVLVDRFDEDVPDRLQTLYSKYGDQINYFGGGCGSITLKPAPCIFDNTGFFQNKALVLFHKSKVQLGIKHGWERIAGPYVVSDSEGNLVRELNWQPAIDVYRDGIKKFCVESSNCEDILQLSRQFSFGIYREGMEDVLRTPFKEEDNGALLCVGIVNKNTSLNILRGEPDDIIHSAGEASRIANENIEPKSVFVFDCISRPYYLGDRFEKELKAVMSHFSNEQEELPLEGVLSMGEISSYGDGFIEFFNKTIVVAAQY